MPDEQKRATRGYVVVEQIEVNITDSATALPIPRTLWENHGSFRAANREDAIKSFLQDKDGKGRTFCAIAEGDWNPVKLDVENVEPKIVFKYEKRRQTRTRRSATAGAQSE